MLMSEALQPNHDHHMCAYLDTGVAKIIGINGSSRDAAATVYHTARPPSPHGRWMDAVCHRHHARCHGAHRVEEALKQRTLSWAAKQLDQFAHIIGHDFRAPLRASATRRSGSSKTSASIQR